MTQPVGIILGDARDIITTLDDESIHLVITSPPYNVGKAYDKHEDCMQYEEHLSWLTAVFTELKDKLVDGGRLCLNIAPTGIKDFMPIHHDLITNLRKAEFRFSGEIIWDKQNVTAGTAWGSHCSPSCPYILPSHEYVYILQKGGRKLKKSDNEPDITKDEFKKFTKPGLWSIKPETTKRGHPSPFPEELVYRLIKIFSYPGDTILDPFCGSGTVGVVCKQLQREFIGIDISEQYCREAEARISNATDVSV